MSHTHWASAIAERDEKNVRKECIGNVIIVATSNIKRIEMHFESFESSDCERWIGSMKNEFNGGFDAD